MRTLFEYLRDVFNPPMTSQQEMTVLELKGLGIYDYKIRNDGTVYVPRSIDLSNKQLKYLPDLSCAVLQGSFSCGDNYLKSLKGAPREVGGVFSCKNNLLENLEHASQKVGRGFICDNNHLVTLAGAPKEVGGKFTCTGNKLSLLEHAPQRFEVLYSDFGQYSSWNDVPPLLQKSKETRELEKLQREALIKNNLATKDRVRLIKRINSTPDPRAQKTGL